MKRLTEDATYAESKTFHKRCVLETSHSSEALLQMGFLDSFGALASSIVAALVMLLFAILSFFVTVFIVKAGAGLAGYSPGGDFVVLSAAILATGAIVAGATPMSTLGDDTA